MKEYMSVKNVKKNFRKCNVVNVNSSYVRSETRRFIIKVQENKHKRIPKNKLEPFFFMDRNDDEYEDCVPSLIQQSLNSIMDDRDNISSDQELELNYLDSSGEHYKIDTNYSMGYTNTSLPQALSTKSSGGLSSVNTNNSFLPIDKKNYLTQPLALKSSRSVN